MTRIIPNVRPGRVQRSLARGFTLIELLLVLVILAVLATLVIPRFAGQGKKAKITGAIGDIAGFKIALGMFESNCGRFPTTEEGLAALVTQPGDVKGWAGPYLDKLSVKPDPWGNPYQYRYPGQHGVDYDLWSYGPDLADGGDDDIDNWSESK